jgi:hypothetical protein
MPSCPDFCDACLVDLRTNPKAAIGKEGGMVLGLSLQRAPARFRSGRVVVSFEEKASQPHPLFLLRKPGRDGIFVDFG